MRQDVPCPFCGLLCDDLAVAASGGGLEVRAAGCHRAREGFARAAGDPTPRIAGRAVALDEAVARAARLLAAARQPLFAGLGTDLDGMRAVLRLADRIGGIVDHLGSPGLFRNLPAQRDQGWIATTLSEVRNRADVILIVGSDPGEAFPRFYERCVAVGETLFAGGPLPRRLFRLGPRATPPDLPGFVSLADIECPLDALPAAVATLRRLVAGQASSADPSLAALAEALRSASYGTVAWNAATLDIAGADLLIQSLAELVRDINRVSRCAVLPLGGSDNLLGANQACLWQSGYPLRTSFAGGTPDHDPHRHESRRLILSGEADALVWISAFQPLPPPQREGLPTIALTSPPVAWAAVAIPVGTPGLDHPGQAFRSDGLVAIRLGALRESPLPSVAEIVNGIERALGDPGGQR
jgi:formylmethanofuran dehydrogenase subunit B